MRLGAAHRDSHSMDALAAGAPAKLQALTADIVSAYVAYNAVQPAFIGELIASVHATLRTISAAAEEPEWLVPPVSIKKSITPDFLISFEDGRGYKSLKRHLTGRGMTPEEYRTK